uniref:Uncharacterized protein n=1 Tax=Romanomermis culicivorax TaxID=13658 RepID=A0A915JKJ1_ROMCU
KRETWFIPKRLCCVLSTTKGIVDFVYFLPRSGATLVAMTIHNAELVTRAVLVAIEVLVAVETRLAEAVLVALLILRGVNKASAELMKNFVLPRSGGNPSPGAGAWDNPST